MEGHSFAFPNHSNEQPSVSWSVKKTFYFWFLNTRISTKHQNWNCFIPWNSQYFRINQLLKILSLSCWFEVFFSVFNGLFMVYTQQRAFWFFEKNMYFTYLYILLSTMHPQPPCKLLLLWLNELKIISHCCWFPTQHLGEAALGCFEFSFPHCHISASISASSLIPQSFTSQQLSLVFFFFFWLPHSLLSLIHFPRCDSVASFIPHLS